MKGFVKRQFISKLCYAISLTIEEKTCLAKTQTGTFVRKW
jgi:hypothetical protein